jgi:hypothetical protein
MAPGLLGLIGSARRWFVLGHHANWRVDTRATFAAKKADRAKIFFLGRAENLEFSYGEMRPNGFPLSAEALTRFKSVTRQPQP